MELRGVRVHNLKAIDVTIPPNQWIAVGGVSGSGKSSLAFDTLYAEGHRRYLESLAPAARRFFDQMPRPEADHIDALPAAIAIRQDARSFPRRTTIGQATEISHYLRLLFSKLGKIVCPDCEQKVRQASPEDVLADVHALNDGEKYLIAFPMESSRDVFEDCVKQGFTRAIVDRMMIDLQKNPPTPSAERVFVIVDRLVAGSSSDERVLDSVEQALASGEGTCSLISESAEPADLVVDGRNWRLTEYRRDRICTGCGREFPELRPALFNPLSPVGACPSCRGIGSSREFSLDQLVPDPSLTLADGALACFGESLLVDRQAEFLRQLEQAGVDIEIPFDDLNNSARRTLAEGVAKAGFGGLRDIFDELSQSSKSRERDLVKRWFVKVDCHDCQGCKRNSEALSADVLGKNIADAERLTIDELSTWLSHLLQDLDRAERTLLTGVFEQIQSRLDALLELDLGDLALDWRISRISAGEAQRVALTRAFCHQLTGSLIVIDEPSAGLHAADFPNVIQALQRLREAGNTLVVVEHEQDFLAAADYAIDLGPGGGQDGGRVVFQGPAKALADAEESLTAQYLSGEKRVHRSMRCQTETSHMLSIRGIGCHPFQNADVEIPLGCLCVVTGPSGSGKTVLLEQVLEPAFQFSAGEPTPRSVRKRFQSLSGAESIDSVVLLDQSRLGGHARSIPATFLNVFDDIRKIFAETPVAGRAGWQLKHFSFNSPSGGRCPECAGQGTVQMEMHLLAELPMICPECQGTRFKSEILAARYRGLNIAEVLNLTITEAFSFFRTSPRVRKRLQVLVDVGLGYLPLGQSTSTLSGGESQRLKLATFLAETRRGRTLFLLDEPTNGLHPADVQTLIGCLEQLLAVGHSVLIAEHNLHLVDQADWIIDLDAGEVAAAGVPDEIANDSRSKTGEALTVWKSKRAADRA